MSKTTRNIIAGSVVIILVLGLVWYAAAQQAPAAEPETTPPATTSTDNTAHDAAKDSAASDQSVITFTDDGATPATLTIKVGEAITIKNDASSSVQFSSDDHPAHREHPEINLQVLQPGTQTKLTISKPGSYTYHDHLNASHTGSIVVTN